MLISICDENNLDLLHYAAALRTLALKHNIGCAIKEYPGAKPLLFDFSDPKMMADILFLDVNMSDAQGIQLVNALRKNGYIGQIIFLTESQKHFLDAFDVDALHYILKGITPLPKIEEIFLKAVKRAGQKDEDYIMFTGGGEYRNVPIRSIRYFETLNKIITVHYDDTSFEFFSENLDKVKEHLSEYRFIRIHRAYLAAISEIAKFSFYDVTLFSGKTLPVGRKYYPELKKIMAENQK